MMASQVAVLDAGQCQKEGYHHRGVCEKLANLGNLAGVGWVVLLEVFCQGTERAVRRLAPGQGRMSGGRPAARGGVAWAVPLRLRASGGAAGVGPTPGWYGLNWRGPAQSGCGSSSISWWSSMGSGVVAQRGSILGQFGLLMSWHRSEWLLEQ